MRLVVTPVGGAGRTARQVVGVVVEYLEGGVGDPGAGVLAAGAAPAAGHSLGDGLVSYYGDSAEGPGRWIGAGAAAHGLDGVVEREALARVLEGRHPETGARLLTAQGSAQRDHLASGTAARFDEWGQPLYSVADSAVLLGWTHGEVEELIASGGLDTVKVGGARLVPDGEIERLLEDAAARRSRRLARARRCHLLPRHVAWLGPARAPPQRDRQHGGRRRRRRGRPRCEGAVPACARSGRVGNRGGTLGATRLGVGLVAARRRHLGARRRRLDRDRRVLITRPRHPRTARRG